MTDFIPSSVIAVTLMTGLMPPSVFCCHVIDISEINPVASIGHVTDITSEPACLNSVLTALCISRGWLQLQGFAVHSIGIPLLCRYLCRTYAVFHGATIGLASQSDLAL